MKCKHYIAILILVSLLFTSCDATYSISIKNKSVSEIKVDAKITNSFNPSITTTVIADKNNRLQFRLESGQEFECGFAIAELKDDLPFNELIIYTKSDTIIAKNNSEVLGLFDKNWIGNFKTPYILTVK